MLASEIREMADADVRTRVSELEEERFRLTFRGATEQLEEPLRVRHIRRDIARLKTILRQRVLETGVTGTPRTATKAAAGKAARTKAASDKAGKLSAGAGKSASAKQKKSAPAGKGA